MRLNAPRGYVSPYFGFGKRETRIYFYEAAFVFYLLVVYPCLPFGVPQSGDPGVQVTHGHLGWVHLEQPTAFVRKYRIDFLPGFALDMRGSFVELFGGEQDHLQ